MFRRQRQYNIISGAQANEFIGNRARFCSQQIYEYKMKNLSSQPSFKPISNQHLQRNLNHNHNYKLKKLGTSADKGAFKYFYDSVTNNKSEQVGANDNYIRHCNSYRKDNENIQSSMPRIGNPGNTKTNEMEIKLGQRIAAKARASEAILPQPLKTNEQRQSHNIYDKNSSKTAPTEYPQITSGSDTNVTATNRQLQSSVSNMMNCVSTRYNILNHTKQIATSKVVSGDDFQQKMPQIHKKSPLTEHLHRARLVAPNYQQGFQDRAEKQQFHRKRGPCSNVCDIEKGYGSRGRTRFFRKFK